MFNGQNQRRVKRSRSSKKLFLEALEQKQLLDAAGFGEVFGGSAANLVDSSRLDVRFTPLVESNEIVFVDTEVEGYETLLKGVDPMAEVIVLDADRDGVHQMAEALAARSGITAIHVVSHGDQAELQLGNAKLTAESMGNEHADDLAAIRESLSDNADILVYGCDFGKGDQGQDAAEQLAQLTGADVAASDDLTGPRALGGDWDFEVTVGDVQSQLAFSSEAQESLVTTLQLVGFSAIVASDGTPSYDGDDNPGNDSGPNNGVIRSHDITTFNVDFSTDSGGATNPTVTATLPFGMIWEVVPAVGTGANSGIFDSTTGAPGGDMRTIVIHMPDIAGALSTSIPVQARALGVQNGTPVDAIKFTMSADELASDLESAEMDLVISSAPFMDIQLDSPTFRGVHNNPSTGEDGAVYSYSVGILGNHPTRSGADAVKGSAPIEDPFTFDVDLSAVTPNAEVFTWGPSIGIVHSDDGFTRNYERVNGGATTSWSRSNRPSGQTDEHTSATWDAERSTPDSGDATLGAGTPGGTYPVTVTGADTDGPLPDFYGGGGVIPADEGWFASYQVHIWMPLSDIDPGEDGIAGTSDDGILDVTPRITNFDPDDFWNDQNNYGAGVEDPANNEWTHTIVSNSIGGPVKRLFEFDRWRWVETSSNWHAGDGVTSAGHQYDVGIHSGQNLGVTSQPGLIWGDKFDNTSTKIVPISNDRSQGGLWSRIHSNQTSWTSTYGVDYIIEFGTGGVGGDPAGWTDWNSMGDATLEDSETSTVWTEDPTDAALGGTPDPVTGVRDSITKWRVKLLRNLEPGETIHAFVTMETIGHSTLDLAADPTGDTIGNMLARTADFLQNNASTTDDWRTSEYNPLDNGWFPEGASGDVFRGDRLRFVEAQVRVDKQVVDTGTGGNFLAGSTATFTIDPTVTIPGPDNGSPAADVVLTDILPVGLTLVAGSITPTSVNGNPVEYCITCDGSDWTSFYPTTGLATGFRYNYGDVPLNTALPQIQFDVLVPFDAPNGQNYENRTVIESPSDPSEEEWRDSQAGITAVQVAALSVSKVPITPVVPEDTLMIYELGVANVSEDKDIPYIDTIDLLPFSGDEDGSSFSGNFTNINITNLDPSLDVYVTNQSPVTLDNQDSLPGDGFADPGVAGVHAWYDAPGDPAGDWEHTLADVVGGSASYGVSDITGIRVLSNGAVTPQLPPATSTKWRLELMPNGNVGIPSDIYVNDISVRTDPVALAEPTFSGPATIIVVAPDVAIEKETCLDELGVDCDPTNDAHWAETATFDDTNEVTFRLKAINTGTSDLTTVTVTDTIPAGLTYVPSSAVASSGDVTGFEPTWTLNLVAGDTQYMTFSATSATPDSYSNVASVAATDQFGQSASDSDDSGVAFETEISVAKHQTGVVRSTTNPDHFEVSYEVELANTSAFDLANVTLAEDLHGAFDAGFVSVLTPPAITASTISAGGTAPTLNGAFDGNVGGAGDSQILNADGLLKPTDSVTVTYTVIVDVTQLADAPNTFNQVVGGGVSGGPGGAPVTDLSDDGDDPTSDNPTYSGDDGAGGTDDPTPLRIPLIDLEKEIVGAPVPAFSGTNGNFEVTYEFTLTNTGTTDLDNVGVEEDFLANMGSAFVDVVQGPTVTSSTATDDPDINAPYDGGTADADVFVTVPQQTNFEFGGNTAASFVGKQTVISDNSLIVDPNQVYTLMADVSAGDGAGGNFDPASSHYLGYAAYDIDGLRITQYHTRKFNGSTDTTLAAPLNPGIRQSRLQTPLVGTTRGSRISVLWHGMATPTAPVTPIPTTPTLAITSRTLGRREACRAIRSRFRLHGRAQHCLRGTPSGMLSPVLVINTCCWRTSTSTKRARR